MLGLVLVTMIGSIDVALGKDYNKRTGRHDNGRYEHRGRGYDRDRYVYHRPYGYGGRVYAPPRVIYEPPPPPGIGIFFPPLFIR